MEQSNIKINKDNNIKKRYLIFSVISVLILFILLFPGVYITKKLTMMCKMDDSCSLMYIIGYVIMGLFFSNFIFTVAMLIKSYKISGIHKIIFSTAIIIMLLCLLALWIMLNLGGA